MLDGSLPLLLLLVVQVLLPAPSSGSLPPDDLTILHEVCQFVYGEREKMLDLINDGKDVEEYEEYTTEWIVSVSGGRGAADKVAERLGFVNEGPIVSYN